jgi:hypothetical protein
LSSSNIIPPSLLASPAITRTPITNLNIIPPSLLASPLLLLQWRGLSHALMNLTNHTSWSRLKWMYLL